LPSVSGRNALRALVLGLLATVAAGCGGDRAQSAGAPSVRPVTLGLDFTPNAVHAGIYAALEEGHDRANGISLRVREPASSPDSLKLLAAGRADVGVLDIHDLGLAHERGADVVGIAALAQRPLAAVIARQGIRRPRELEGRRVGVTGLPSDDAVLRAVVEGDGGRFERVRRVTIGFSAVPSLVAGTVDAVTAFWNVEGVALRERGVRTREFKVEEFGAPVYPEVVLVSRRETVERQPALLRRVVGALSAGTRSALADPDPVVARLARASGAEPALVRAQLDAVTPALRGGLALRREPLEQWARWDARFGILARTPDVDTLFAPELAG
jgi:NitT/TauT family transport system substrate-binding protein/putative hydroxymethylpyrimidine transport system substrate-binding protein